MKVTAEKVDTHKMLLEMEIPQPEVAKAVEKAYRKLADKLNIPGFRKGKVPRKVLEMRVGKEVLLDEAFESLAPAALQEALLEHKIEPVSRPEFEVVTLKEDQPLIFKATVIAKPEVILGEYKGLKVAKPKVEITAEDVDKDLEGLRERYAKMVVVENAEIQKGDFAIIDFEGFINGEPFKGGEAKSYPLEIGAGTFIPGFEEQLIGAKAGDELEVKVTFPEDYYSPDVAGKEAAFKVKVNDVKRRELPEIDDDLVKEISQLNTVEELRAERENKLKQTAEEKANSVFRGGSVKLAVENASMDVPDVMVESQIDNMVQELDVTLQNQGMSLEKYMEHTNTDIKAFRENYRDVALFNVKTDLVLEAVAKEENIKVNPEEIEKEMQDIAANYNAPLEEVRKIFMEEGRLDSLIKSVVSRKASQLIVDSAVEE